MIFDDLAKAILIETQLCIAGSKTEEMNFTEIEFYFHDNKLHNDDYCHCNPQQLQFGKWYFHQASPHKYKARGRIGIDLCLGNSDGNHFGILISRPLTIPET